MNYLKELLNLEILVEPNVANDLNKLGAKDFEKMLEHVKTEKPLVLSREILERFLKRTEFRIIKEFEPVKSYTIQDYVTLLNDKFNKLQDILIKKVELKDAVSINKARTGKVSVIGMVKDMQNGIELEDTTGTINVSLKNNVSLDDVIAVTGIIRNKILFAEKMIYPDVPLRGVNYSEKEITIGFENSDYIVSENKIEDKIRNKTYEITNPYVIQIDNVIILITFDHDPLEILKKRYLHKDNTDFILEVVPDVIINNKLDANYKGISIISKGRINLKNRELN